MKKKLLVFILVGVLLYITVIIIEFCCLYAVLGDEIWNYLKDFFAWYKTFFI